MGTCVTKPNSKKADDILSAGKNVQDIDALVANGIPNRVVEQKNEVKEEEDPQDPLSQRDMAAQSVGKENGGLLKIMAGGKEICFEEEKEKLKNRFQKKGVKIRGDAVVDGTIYETFTKTNKKKTKQDTTFIISCLRSHFVFYNLAEQELENIVNNMFSCEVNEDTFVFKQGDNASTYFILEKGAFEVIINGQVKKNLKPGDGFGELALLYSAPRSASIRAKEKCLLWAIDRGTFRKAIEEMVSKEYEENRKFIDAVRFFQFMTVQQRDSIARVLITQKFQKGENIVNEGDQASSFYIIKDGNVSIIKGGKEIRVMPKGESFGEQALYYNTVRACSVRALDEVKCLALGRDTLTNILGDQVQAITFRNVQKWAFDKSDALKPLTKLQIEKLVDNMKVNNFSNGELIIKKGEKPMKLYIVIEGSVKKGGQEIGKGFAFADENLWEKFYSKKAEENYTMEGDGVLSSIPYSDFFTCIGGKLEDVIKKNETSHEKLMAKKVEKRDVSALKIEDLVFIKKLGFGQFGSVYLTKNKSTSDINALKSVSKGQIIEQSLEKHLLQEKNVMEQLDFPFIVHLVRTYKDSNNVYFLEEYVRGMELFDVIRDIGLLNTYDSQFYISALILCLEYLHTRMIIYRDIKPENLMVDAKGYLKMIDLGTAKILSGKSAGRTFTIIGTPHYMAPEIISGKGYSFNVDLWSVGIVLFEFMCGGVPFAEEADDPYEIYEEIIKKPLTFPTWLKDKKAKKLMNQLLNKIPDLRLGGSYASLKANSWFDNFDWDKLYNRELKPPFLPPKDKMISDNDMKKMFDQGKSVLDEIRIDSANNKYKKEAPKDPNWDKDF